MVDRKYTTRPGTPDSPPDDGAWFAQRQFGFGSGWPIRWQGWALIGGYIAVLLLVKWLDEIGSGAARAAAFALFLAATAVLASLAARHTRGGWTWRWGGKD